MREVLQKRSSKKRWPNVEAKEKDRFAARAVADQPLHAGESLGQSLFPRDDEAELAEAEE
jgi:hypothetical protein